MIKKENKNQTQLPCFLSPSPQLFFRPWLKLSTQITHFSTQGKKGAGGSLNVLTLDHVNNIKYLDKSSVPPHPPSLYSTPNSPTSPLPLSFFLQSTYCSISESSYRSFTNYYYQQELRGAIGAEWAYRHIGPDIRTYIDFF